MEPNNAEDKKVVEKVVKGTVTTRKPSEPRKFMDNLIKSDFSHIKDYAIYDVLLPSISNLMTDALNGAVNMLFHGEPGSRKSSSSSGTYSSKNKPSYRSYYDEPRETKPSEGRRNQFAVDDIILESRVEAEDVLDHLYDLTRKYKSATVADLYELIDIECSNYMANKYGWEKLDNASVKPARGGYRLDLPRPTYLG